MKWTPTRAAMLSVALAAAVLALGGCSSDDDDDDGEGGCNVASPSLESLRVTVDGGLIRDGLGRELLLRGVNTGGRAKLPPFVAFPFSESGRAEQAGAAAFDEALAAYANRVRDWGHNVVRLPFTWHALEPTRGTYDDAFLDRYEAIAKAFSDRGIRVIVDFHQDVFATPFCGDGFPPWAIVEPLDETKERNCHQWFLGYLQDEEVMAAYDHFWKNTDGLQDAFEKMWGHVAARLWAVDGVIGFEVINEPGWGTAAPAEWGPNVLTPFYTKMIGVIRQAAPGAPIFFDSTGSDAISGTTHVQRPEGDGLVFAPHFYDAPVILLGRWTGDSDLMTPLGNWRTLGDEWKVPVIVGEFGIKSTAEGAAEYVRLNYEAMDTLRLHGTLWEYSTTTDDWNEEGMSIIRPDGVASPIVDEVIRAYPRAVAGTLQSFAFDRGKRTGTLTWVATAGGVTELAAPTLLYPEGAHGTLEGASACVTDDREGQVLRIRVEDNATVTLTFGPAAAP